MRERPVSAVSKLRTSWCGCAVVAVGLLLLAAPAGAFVPVPVAVHAAGDGDRTGWPVTVSVPFARGALRPEGAVRVVDERGRARPTQYRALAKWPDGSVRWLLVDTALDLRAGQGTRLTVELGRGPAPRPPLRLSESAEAIAVDTGAMRFAIPKRRFAIVDGLQLAGTARPALGPVSAVLEADGKPAEAAVPRQVTVLDAGPLRARVALEGTYGNSFDYVIRVEAYAGQPFVRVWHTFIDRRPAPYTPVSRIAIEVPLRSPLPARYRYGIDGERPMLGELDDDSSLRLVQPDNLSWSADGQTQRGTLEGWLELAGGDRVVGIGSRWFWQEYPQSFTAGRERLVYNLWAPEVMPARSGVGAAKTHEFVLWAGPPVSSGAAGLAGAIEPVVAAVDPARLAETGALPLAVDPTGDAKAFVAKALAAARRYEQRNASEEWEDCGRVRCEPAGSGVRRIGAYGMWNWGDWNFRGYRDTTKGTDSWGNLEYDTALVLALTYAATGDPGVQRQMVAAARHFIDVDTIHASPTRPEWVGMNHPKNPLHFSFELGGPDLGHTWTQGTLAYWFLTGDERGLAAARGVADYLVARSRRVRRGNPRQWGWPIIALLAFHDATGEERYRDAAMVYATRGMAAHPPRTGAPWKLGILADALAYAHAASGDRAMKRWLQQYAAAVMQADRKVDARLYPAVAYVGARSDDRAMIAATRKRAQQLDLGSWGKPFSINGRIGFRILSVLGDR